MIDIVVPKGNEKAFIAKAKELGYSGIVFVKGKPIKADISIFNEGKDIIIHKHNEEDRKLVERKRVDLIYGLELEKRRDYMHSRASGLEQVMCKLFHLKDVLVGFSFKDLLKARPVERSLIMGRMMQNIRWCRKFKIKTAIFSFASRPEEMRKPEDLIALFEMLGMHPKEAKDSFNSILKKIKGKKEHVAKGIRKIK